MSTEHDLVLVVDFGAQYAQLIARRVREARVYSEIVPHTMPVEEMLARKPAAIILSGGPKSVSEEDAPKCDPRVLELGLPTVVALNQVDAAEAAGIRIEIVEGAHERKPSGGRLR